MKGSGIYEYGAESDRGSVRAKNEDYFGVFEPEKDELLEKSGLLIVVSDGMGGHFSGAEASHAAVEVVGEVYFKGEEDEADSRLKTAFQEANKYIFDRIGERVKGRAGTTCTAAVLYPDLIHVVHVGDSRAYIVREGGIFQLTRDHSVVGEMMRRGVLSQEEARTDPRRNIITKAMGLREFLEADVYDPVSIRKGDRIVICTDGLFSLVDEATIADFCEMYRPREACVELVRLSNERGGTDNITVIVAERL